MTNTLTLSDKANMAQREASDPFISAWVSASAGSGKTKVLTDRVLRLLLAGNAPETILCLTYTKAAAAEMANRLSKTLRDWIGYDDVKLLTSLKDLTGEPEEELTEKIAFARTLFAKVLDTNGGMKIMTIHSFCQNVLKRFPLEAKRSAKRCKTRLLPRKCTFCRPMWTKQNCWNYCKIQAKTKWN